MNEISEYEQEKRLIMDFLFKNTETRCCIKNYNTASKKDLYNTYKELREFIIKSNLEEHSYACYILTILHKLLNNINGVTENEIITIENIISIITLIESKIDICNKVIITNVALLNGDVLIEKNERDIEKMKCTNCIRHMVLR